MNIAVDARPLAHPHNGIGRYTTNLLREFASQQPTHRIFLYSDRPFQLDYPLPEQWKVRTGAVRSGGLSTAFAQLVFPVWALKDEIDVFWAPRHHLPILLIPRIRKVLTVHDLIWKRFPKTMKRGGRVIEAILMPLSLRVADQIIAVSQFTCTEVLTFFPHTKYKLNVVYEASSLINDGTIGPRLLSTPYFLFVGSNGPRKNMKRLLLAYIQYRELSPYPLDLVIAGTERWGDFSVIDFIQANNLQSCLHLIQNVDDTALCSLYEYTQALVMVSLYEGFGLPLVEAMQWGIPLIASNNSAIAEIAATAALFVDPYDTDAIAQAFKQMTEDQAVRSNLAHNAKIRAQQFSWKRAGSEMMALIVGDRINAK